MLSIWQYCCHQVINGILYAKCLIQRLSHRKLFINKSYYDDNVVHDDNDDGNNKHLVNTKSFNQTPRHMRAHTHTQLNIVINVYQVHAAFITRLNRLCKDFGALSSKLGKSGNNPCRATLGSTGIPHNTEERTENQALWRPEIKAAPGNGELELTDLTPEYCTQVTWLRSVPMSPDP